MVNLFDQDNQLVIKRDDLAGVDVDIGGRDIIIGFNEPAFKMSLSGTTADLDSKLNARLASYFLPAVEIAKKQTRRPRLILVSGLNVALKWNASTEKEKKIMTINNNLKFDFLNHFFDTFFPGTFSAIACVVAQDPIKISDDKLMELWGALEQHHPDKMREIKFQLARFKKPKLFNKENISEEAKKYVASDDPELTNSCKYAIAHLLAFGDINFEGDFIHNPIGYISIGGYQEKTFNKIRAYAYELLKKDAESFFERKVLVKDNLRLIVENSEHVPPPYNGYYRKNGDRLFLDEVTYENDLSLDFYDTHKKLKFDMSYVYNKFVPKAEYEKFWHGYREKYFELKASYRKAYSLEDDF